MDMAQSGGARFRVNARHFFATWPRSDCIGLLDLHSHLQQLDPAPVYVATAREHHTDGGIHYHAVVGKCGSVRHVSHVSLAYRVYIYRFCSEIRLQKSAPF